MKDLGHWIDGKRVAGTSGRHGDIFNPAVGEKSGRVAFAGAGEVDAAVQAAQAALPQWAATTPLRRGRIMFALKALLEQHIDELAELVSSEHGKTLADAKGSITRGIDLARAGERDPARLLAHRRIEDVAVAAARAGDPPAVDPVPEVLHAASPAIASIAWLEILPRPRRRPARRRPQAPRPCSAARAQPMCSCRKASVRSRARRALSGW